MIDYIDKLIDRVKNSSISIRKKKLVIRYFDKKKNAIQEEYSKNINNGHGDIKEPYELFGIECGVGWYHLLIPIFEYIDKYNEGKEYERQIKICQIKEKFGGLRFYTNFGTDELHRLIDEAEDESFNTCEVCGKRCKQICEGHWVYTLCKKCYNNMVIERQKSYERFKEKIKAQKAMMSENSTSEPQEGSET